MALSEEARAKLAKVKKSVNKMPSRTRGDIINAIKAEPIPNPIDEAEQTGDIEKDSYVELNAMQKAFKDRARAEEDRFTMATDTEYWFAVCFVSRKDKEDFLAAAGLVPKAEFGDKYLDGYVVAEKLGLTQFLEGE